ncbi:MAG: PAS domain-containing protein [Alphaproteobacteria bacterium]|nr:PAS domain-containing protein [Alphaproteobacteria bacterium]
MFHSINFWPDTGIMHANNMEMFGWWNRLRGKGKLVNRSEINVRQFAQHMPWMIIVGGSEEQGPAMGWRYSGSRLENVFQPASFRHPFELFWASGSRSLANGAVDMAQILNWPFLLRFQSRVIGSGLPVMLEMIGLPMMPKGPGPAHFIGAIQVCGKPLQKENKVQLGSSIIKAALIEPQPIH